MNPERMLGNRLNKKIRLDQSLIDGYQHTSAPYPSPLEGKDCIQLAEKELESVEGWNKILSSTITKNTLDKLTVIDLTDDLEDPDF